MGTPTGTAIFVGGKPPLNEDNVNNLAAAVIQATETSELGDLLQRARNDWRAFLADQFALTDNQTAAINSLGQVAVDRIQRSVNDAIQTRSIFRVVSVPALALPTGGICCSQIGEQARI